MHILHVSDFLYIFPFQIKLPLAEIFSPENYFLIAITLIWLIIAAIQDFKNREVENWWSFGMIAFVLAFRAFVSIESMSFMPFVWGLAGLAAGFILANAFYYGRIFAAGDAKVLITIGAFLPLSPDWQINLVLLLAFVFLVLLVGGVYGAIYSAALVLINCRRFAKSFSEHFEKHKALVLGIAGFCFTAFIVFLWLELYLIAFLAVLVGLTPFLLIYGKSAEDSCMISEVPAERLTVGDWIVNPVRAGRKIVRPYWEGLSEEELRLIQKKCKGRKILVKSGIPFVPVFLLAFIALLVLI